MEAGSGGMLRLLRGHTRAVHACQFTPHNKHLATGGDDQIIKYWDVSSGQCILDMQGHSDHVRCMATNPASADVLATGSYDHTVRPPTLLARRLRFPANSQSGQALGHAVGRASAVGAARRPSAGSADAPGRRSDGDGGRECDEDLGCQADHVSGVGCGGRAGAVGVARPPAQGLRCPRVSCGRETQPETDADTGCAMHSHTQIRHAQTQRERGTDTAITCAGGRVWERARRGTETHRPTERQRDRETERDRAHA
eukprot:545596-Rhodomonas_salina.2